MGLRDVEREVLRSIPGAVTGEAYEARPYAYAVWTDRRGDVQMGPVRARRQSPGESGFLYECSPFPGAWDGNVPESSILRVRHLGALTLDRMDCVCPPGGGERMCPSRECRTLAVRAVEAGLAVPGERGE